MQTPEAKEKVARANRLRNASNPVNKGRIWICKNDQRKMIYPEDFNFYELEGWRKGYKE